MSTRPAVFLDRDGTVIREAHYLADPALVDVLPGAAEAITRLRASGYACVIVSNQSAVARGYLTMEGLALVHAALEARLGERGAALDGAYYCPEAPRSKDRTLVDHPDRKPGPGMLLRAARELGLNVAASWMVGDMVSDLLAGNNAGCRGSILVRTGYGAEQEVPPGLAVHTATDLSAAAEWILTKGG